MSMTRYANDIMTGPAVIVALDCADCGVVFGINADFEQRRRDDGRSFYCPNGHSLSWNSEHERIKRRLAYTQGALTHERDQRQAAERSARAYKGQATRIRRRVGRGVCPCCNRTFADLAKHMAGQHPEFVEDDA